MNQLLFGSQSSSFSCDTSFGRRTTHWIMAAVCVLILVMGFRAVIGLYGLGA